MFTMPTYGGNLNDAELSSLGYRVKIVGTYRMSRMFSTLDPSILLLPEVDIVLVELVLSIKAGGSVF